jgi:hypothetical protein
MLEKYFEDEVRDGFYVPSMIKRSWAVELDVLSEVDRICQKYDIKYYAEWGTLLGAVRHAGFVPGMMILILLCQEMTILNSVRLRSRN